MLTNNRHYSCNGNNKNPRKTLVLLFQYLYCLLQENSVHGLIVFIEKFQLKIFKGNERMQSKFGTV